MTVASDGGANAPSSLLFLSCDLVDSTAHKKGQSSWRRTFLTFYRGFPQALAARVATEQTGVSFDLWKIIGDEMIFTCDVRHERDVDYAVRAWLDAMTSYEQDTITPEGMRLRGGAFLATFPGPDSRIAVPLSPLAERSNKGVIELNDEALSDSAKSRYLHDYFGPSIDIGFKVLAQSDARHFTLSVEVAWAMAHHAANQSDAAFDDLRVFGSDGLPELWKSGRYPRFSIDREHGVTGEGIAHALRQMTMGSPEPGRVCDVCRMLHADPEWPSAIYLPDSDTSEFRVLPDDCLAPLRTNAMEGAESTPPQTPLKPIARGRARSVLDSRTGLT